MKKYSTIVFDIDGTLIDSEETGILSLGKTIKELTGKEMTYDELYVFFGIPSIATAEALGYADKKRFGDLWEEHFLELKHLMKTFPGVVDVIRALKKEGYILGLCTSRSRIELANDIIMKDLIPIFDCYVCSEDSKRHKPNPDPMLAFLKKASVISGREIKGSECLYIGDTIYDYKCSHGALCDFALADWRNRGLQGIPAEFRFTTAEELLSIIHNS